MGARRHLNSAVRRRCQSEWCGMAGGMGCEGSITGRGALLRRETQLSSTPTFCISQSRVQCSAASNPFTASSLAASSGPDANLPPGVTNGGVWPLALSAQHDDPTFLSAAAPGSRSPLANTMGQGQTAEFAQAIGSSFRAEAGNAHQRRILEPMHPSGGTKRLLSTVSRFDRQFPINSWCASVPCVRSPLPPAANDNENA